MDYNAVAFLKQHFYRCLASTRQQRNNLFVLTSRLHRLLNGVYYYLWSFKLLLAFVEKHLLIRVNLNHKSLHNLLLSFEATLKAIVQ